MIEDVTVVDKIGRAIKGLSAADFLLREDTNPQTIVSLEEHSPAEGAIAIDPYNDKMPAKGTQTEINLVSNKLPAGDVGM